MQYRGFQLDPFQVQAIEALQAGHSVLVAAPTGTGKTVVADQVVERALAEGREVIYTAPIKALSNQKFRDYCKLLGEDKVGLVTGDLVIRRDAPCRVMTTEILRNMLLTGEDLPDLQAVIIDEIHFLGDRDRGTTWEELLIYLDHKVQIVGLSATLANLDDFASWLSAVRGQQVVVVEEHKRAVPLRFELACREGGLRTVDDMARFGQTWVKRNSYAIQRARKQRTQRGRGRGGRAPRVGSHTRHHNIFKMLWPHHAPYLYFVFSRRDAETMARRLVERMDESLLTDEEQAQVFDTMARFIEDPSARSALDDELAWMLEHGVAFHHAGLNVLLKGLVESLYERKLVKVLYCTGTFALGINMPARSAVFDGLMRFDGREMIQLPTREFMQMAGRAGRRGMDDEGLVVIRADVEGIPELIPQVRKYLAARYEPVRSQFSLSFNSVVNLLDRHPPARIRELVDHSFLSWVRAQRAEQDTRHIDHLRDELARKGWKDGAPVPPKLKKQVRQLRQLRRKQANPRDRTWGEFVQRVEFLQRWGFVDPDRDDAFNAGAKVLMHVQISEIFVTELFLQGVFEQLDMPVFFGVLCALCNDLPRGAVVRGGREHRPLGRQIAKVRFSDIVTEAEAITRQEVTWDPAMIGLGAMWARGDSLADIMLAVEAPTDISGDLVGAFRRAKDLAGQIRDAWGEEPDKQTEIRALIRHVSRDEVEVVG